MTDTRRVTKELLAAGLAAKASPREDAWVLDFSIDAETQGPTTRLRSILFLPPGGKYFVAITAIPSATLKGSLDDLSRSQLSTLVREGSSVLLAKLHYVETDDGRAIYSAVSECSVEGWTGEKLKRRIEATVKLAARILAAVDRPAAAPAARPGAKGRPRPKAATSAKRK